MRVIIAGGGELGARLAETLSKENDVVLIEKDESRAEHLGERLSSMVMFGDATDKEILRHASVEKCDALLAVTGDDGANSAICELGRSFGVKRVAARLNDAEKGGLFSKTGAAAINVMDSAVNEFKRAIGHRNRKC